MGLAPYGRPTYLDKLLGLYSKSMTTAHSA